MKFIKSLGFGIIVFLVFNLIITIFSFFNILSDEILNIIKVISYVITYISSGIYLGILVKKKSLINASILSLLYIIISLLLVLLLPSLEISFKLIINYLFLIIIINIGTFIGINKRRSK